MQYSQPSVYLWGIRIDEPVTSLTALIISGVCLYAFVKLGRAKPGNKTIQYLRYYFILMALATANGGVIGHAFLSHLSFEWKLVGWLTSMCSIMLIERASIEYTGQLISPRITEWLKRINILELIIFMGITIYTLNFFYVEVHTTYGLLVVVAGLHGFVYQRTRSEGSRNFLIAVGFAAISALIYMNEISISRWFNYNDISHVFLTGAAWYFYKGSLRIGTEKIDSSAREKRFSNVAVSHVKNQEFA